MASRHPQAEVAGGLRAFAHEAGSGRGTRSADPRAATSEDEAAAIAIAALSHFATDTRTMQRFFAMTGLDAESLRVAAGSPGFIAGVLDFVLADERLLLAVAEAQETTPEAVAAARRRLDARDPVADDWPPPPTDDWA